jgi:hypothetical protein
VIAICAALAAVVPPATAVADPHAPPFERCDDTYTIPAIHVTGILASPTTGCQKAMRVVTIFAHEPTCFDKEQLKRYCTFYKSGVRWGCEHKWAPGEHHHSWCRNNEGAQVRLAWKRPH